MSDGGDGFSNKSTTVTATQDGRVTIVDDCAGNNGDIHNTVEHGAVNTYTGTYTQEHKTLLITLEAINGVPCANTISCSLTLVAVCLSVCLILPHR